jgi:transcriptional regulator with XRE-family HTH domain
MTDIEFRRALRALGWTQERTAQELGLSLRTVTRYAAGTTRIPTPVVLALKAARERARRVIPT